MNSFDDTFIGKLIDRIGQGLLIIILLAGMGFLFAIPTKLLWNWLMPIIFDLPKLTYMQAWGIALLFSFLIPHHSAQI